MAVNLIILTQNGVHRQHQLVTTKKQMPWLIIGCSSVVPADLELRLSIGPHGPTRVEQILWFFSVLGSAPTIYKLVRFATQPVSYMTITCSHPGEPIFGSCLNLPPSVNHS